MPTVRGTETVVTCSPEQGRAGGTVRITMTLTARGCPLHDVMTEWARTAVSAVPGVDRVEVVLAFDPPWTPDRIRR